MADLTYVYLGSTRDAKEILERSGLDPALVVSFSDSREDEISGFAQYDEYGDRWLQVDTINGERAANRIHEVAPDVVFVMSWQELLSPELLEIPSKGYVGRHLSMLPKRRGRAPVAWSLIHGLETTGQTLFWLDEGVDSGDVLLQTEVPIDPTDEASDLFDRHADATVGLLSEAIELFDSESFPREPQDEEEATYTHPRRPDMGLIDWRDSASKIYDFVRGQSHPYPGAFTYHRMDKISIWHADILHRTQIAGTPGEVLESIAPDEYRVQTGEGTLRVEVENHHGEHPIEVGSLLGGHGFE